MKRIVSAICGVFLLCNLLFMVNIGTTMAGNPAYSIIEYVSITTATVDGRWTASDEWTDTPVILMSGNASGRFGYNIQDFTNLGLEWIIEIFTDNTDDAGDYWQICLDDLNGGGTAPQIGDYMIEITGHRTLRAFQGTGSGWSQITPASGELRWNNTIGISPWSSTPHWILEIVDSSKTAGTIQVPNPPPTGMRVAAFDASTNTLAAWPPNSTANNPNSWGVVADFSMEPIPESLSFGVFVVLSSVALIVGSIYLRKRPKATILTQ